MESFLQSIHPYIAGLLIGFFIGFERERAAQKTEPAAMGVRTFAFLGLLGALAGSIHSEWVRGLLALFALSGVLLSYWRGTRDPVRSDIGLTTEVAAAVVFALGYIAVSNRMEAFILGALTLGLLSSKKTIHAFTKEKISQAEAEAFIALVVLGIGVLPFLDRSPIDPWGIFVPFRLGLLIFMLSLIQFSSHALLKVFGERAGSFLAGFLGGFVSSTASFVNVRSKISHREKADESLELVAFALMAVCSSALLSAGILFSSAPHLIEEMWISYGLVFLICVGVSALAFTKDSKTRIEVASEKGQTGPLNVKSQLSFAVVLFLVMGLASFAHKFFGQTAFLAVSFVGGLFELHGVTFALGSMPQGSQVLPAMSLAFLASLLSKAAIILSAPQANKKMKVYLVAALGCLALAFVIPLFL